MSNEVKNNTNKGNLEDKLSNYTLQGQETTKAIKVPNEDIAKKTKWGDLT